MAASDQLIRAHRGLGQLRMWRQRSITAADYFRCAAGLGYAQDVADIESAAHAVEYQRQMPVAHNKIAVFSEITMPSVSTARFRPPSGCRRGFRESAGYCRCGDRSGRCGKPPARGGRRRSGRDGRGDMRVRPWHR
ncbi:hypothetical protein SDC9_173920 [bioreactor metagenome]|uniref:Uncharacterized protein n=1 Tax=bioreactor metagenome TaxID=1076179 RepID=A0A645GIG6_9ZZZZ